MYQLPDTFQGLVVSLIILYMHSFNGKTKQIGRGFFGRGRIVHSYIWNLLKAVIRRSRDTNYIIHTVGTQTSWCIAFNALVNFYMLNRPKDRIFSHKSEIQRGLTDHAMATHLIKEHHTVSHLGFQVIDSNPAEIGW